ncbi:MAG: hypothetical protein WC294_06420 [Methanoregula sp.]|jgi:hypothetical protein
MTFTLLAKKKKNSVPATTTSDVTAVATTIPVSHAEYFHDVDGVLITSGIVIGFDNAVRSRAEEITITDITATSGPADITGITRGVNADGTIGVGYAWPSGTSIAVMGMTTGDWNKIKDNFADLPQSRNAIINGDCRVNQRVTAYTLVKDAYTWDSSDLYGPDRHEGMATGTAVSAGTWGQSTTCVAGNSGYGFKFASVTLTGTGILYHRHRIEAKDAVRFKNMTASFSVKVYHDVGSNINYTIYVRKANSANNFAAVTAISNSGAISVPTATATALKYENVSMGDVSNGIEIEIKIECGAITTKNFCQTELQLELGSVATAFEIIPISIEEQRCKYYYERIFPAINYGVYGQGFCDSTTSVLAYPQYQPKRVAPTISFSNVTDFLIRIAGGGLVATTNMSGVLISRSRCAISATVASGLTAGTGCALDGKVSTTHFIAVGCEL